MVTISPTPSDTREDAGLGLGSVDVFTRFDDARNDWLELFAAAPASAYQAYNFVRAWFETIGEKQSLEPMIVVARNERGVPLALLPLAQEQCGPLRLAKFLCGKDSNFNLGLFRPGARFDESTVRKLLAQAARAAPRRPDLFYLRNQPRQWEQTPNPLALAGSWPSPSFGYRATLPLDPKELDARFSKDDLRRKKARLASLGALAFEHNVKGPRAVEMIQALLEQKTARLESKHIDKSFLGSAMRDFLTRSCAADGPIEIHALTLDGKAIAIRTGLTHRGRFSGMLSSFHVDPRISRYSPGILLLQDLLRNLVTRGFTHLDAGVGEAYYKANVCDETIELCETIVPVTAKGAIAAPIFSALLRAKRKIKQTPWMFSMLATARKLKGVLNR